MYCGGWEKCLASVVSLCSAFLCVVIKRLQCFSCSFKINMQMIGEYGSLVPAVPSLP